MIHLKKLAVVLILLAIAILPATAQEVITHSDGTQCNMEGTASSASGKDLNRHKNRFTAPLAEAIDNDVSLAAMLTPGDDVDRFDQEKGATIVGFVVDVKVGGKETCNCGAVKPVDRDTHIELAMSSEAD